MWREGGSNGGARSGRKQEAGAEEEGKVEGEGVRCGREGGAFDRARPGRSGRRERRSHVAIPVVLPSSSAVVVVVLSWARSPSL